jgi:mannose-6-phosphate isomerase-like protein (cupin superfamily)
MSYSGDGGQVSAILRPFDSVPALVRPTSATRFTATGELTHGEFGLFHWSMQPRAGGPAAHFHRTFSESFYILTGSVRLYDGANWLDTSANDFLYIPQGGIHAFANDSDEPASMLILFAPGAPRERYFEAIAEIANAGRQLSPEEWTALYAEHDQTMV